MKPPLIERDHLIKYINDTRFLKLIYTPSIPRYKSLSLFNYIEFAMYSTLRGSGGSHKRRPAWPWRYRSMEPRLLVLDDLAIGLNRSARLLHLFWKLSFVRATDLQKKKCMQSIDSAGVADERWLNSHSISPSAKMNPEWEC